MEQLKLFETYGVPNDRFHMAPKWVKKWADFMGVSVPDYLDIYEAEIAQQANAGDAKDRAPDF